MRTYFQNVQSYNRNLFQIDIYSYVNSGNLHFNFNVSNFHEQNNV